MKVATQYPAHERVNRSMAASYLQRRNKHLGSTVEIYSNPIQIGKNGQNLLQQ